MKNNHRGILCVIYFSIAVGRAKKTFFFFLEVGPTSRGSGWCVYRRSFVRNKMSPAPLGVCTEDGNNAFSKQYQIHFARSSNVVKKSVFFFYLVSTVHQGSTLVGDFVETIYLFLQRVSSWKFIIYTHSRKIKEHVREAIDSGKPTSGRLMIFSVFFSRFVVGRGPSVEATTLFGFCLVHTIVRAPLLFNRNFVFVFGHFRKHVIHVISNRLSNVFRLKVST